MIYGNRFLDSNAHRCLLQARGDLRRFWQNVRAAFRWQFTRKFKRRVAQYMRLAKQEK